MAQRPAFEIGDRVRLKGLFSLNTPGTVVHVKRRRLGPDEFTVKLDSPILLGQGQVVVTKRKLELLEVEPPA